MIDAGEIVCVCNHPADDHWKMTHGCNRKDCKCGALESDVLLAHIERLTMPPMRC